MFFSKTKIAAIALCAINYCSAQSGTVVDSLKAQANMTIITSIVEKAFAASGGIPTVPITIFAPTDQALLAAGADKLSEDVVNAIVSYHILGTTVKSTDAKADVAFFDTMLTSPDYVNLPNGAAQKLGVYLSNGAVRLNDGSFDPITSPVNVVKADIVSQNATVHIIDKVLTVPGSLSEALAGSPRLALIGKLLDQANLTSTLDCATGITLFAPFESAIQEVLKTNIDPSIENLTPIFLNHAVLGSAIYSSLITGPVSVDSALEGSKLNANRNSDNQVTINNNIVQVANLLTNNGVIHGIDAVLVPDASIYTPKTLHKKPKCAKKTN
ncbi:Stabilin-2 [Smittium culicis]|uniref:Stabilin-2 n=1 Tax=Smittium culicis TaxID=133412 RepID=A0A1R1X2W0_9FUNG|nr:Stabilin-2 [Smittium culicis]